MLNDAIDRDGRADALREGPTEGSPADLRTGRREPARRDLVPVDPQARADPAPVIAAPAIPAPAATAPASPEKPKRGLGKTLLLPLAILAALGAGGWYGHAWWTDGRFLVSTDDAYVAVDMSVVTPKITGYVASVPVKENQVVKAGDPIVEIDPGDYQLALRSAEARIATQRSVLDRIAAQRVAAVEDVAKTEADRSSALAVLDQANLNLQRAENLVKSGAGAQAPLDAARSLTLQAKANLAGADAAIAAARADVGVLDAQAKEAAGKTGELEVDRDMAARNLSFTTLRAPYDGVVGNLAVQPGDLVSPTRRLAAIVPLDEVFIDANFKETQLGEILVGEKVRIEIDALPGVEGTGTVVSLAPASGSVFSLLPADNATGNFTKIVQRVPVRISVDPSDALADRLRPGLSVTVAVDTRTAPAPEAATVASASAR